MRFLCDGMLGRLARDLRLLGFDAAWSDAEDAALLRRAREEDRGLLSRDRDLVAAAQARGVRAARVGSNDPGRQVVEVVAALGLRPSPSAFLSRCSLCNEPLLEGPGREPVAYEAEPPFRHCPRCGRTYWRGTHVEEMRRRFEALWDAGASGPPPY